jgi:DNA helicase-2/ATP-dependent DNA helicase PcrA
MPEQLALGLEEAGPRPRPSRPGQSGSDDGDGRGRPPARRGAVDLARTLGRPEPTPEQVSVIEAPVAPLLVVAGAGSGKTETMAARVVWLVANGHAAPEEVLGLTFTRKAAGELAERVRARLRALHRHGLVAADSQLVTVSTYHAYAAGVLGDHGLRLGLEPGARLLGEAGAWQLAAEVVERWDGDMSQVDNAASTVAEAVLALAGECSEHLVEPRAVTDVCEEIVEHAQSLPASLGDSVPGRPKADVARLLGRLHARRQLVPLVEAYLARKREQEVLDFGDQVALAARVARDVLDVGAGERARYRAVLLDEYQDTSHAQLVLLRSLFGGGHPVVAVGDPHQSIYGWRGASAGNLQRFPTDFPQADGAPAAQRFLSTSWRNDRAVLAAANVVSAELRRPAPWADPDLVVDVPELVPRPGAGPGMVQAAWLATIEDEARVVAEVIDTERRSAPEGAAPPTAAVLCRARAQFPLVEAALRAKGLPVEVVGLGGLLAQPEVADLRAALEVLHDPTRGDSLMRLLTGPAWRIGPGDLHALGAWASERARRSRQALGAESGRPDLQPGLAPGVVVPDVVAPDVVEPDVVAPDVVAPDVVDERSVVDALDELPPQQWVSSAGKGLSDVGRTRLDRLGGILRDLRGRVSLPLPDLVVEVERALGLDVEVATRPRVPPAVARTYLDAFTEVAVGFAASGERVGLGAFLAWLAAADTRERGLETPLTEVRRDAVQVLTVHAAKGLEWDVVAVPGLVEGTFPAGRNGRAPAASNGWLGELGTLPFPLRGDASGLPHWHALRARTQPDLTGELDTFRDHCAQYEVGEERRLAYVAVTRARRRLLLTGAVWGTGSTPRKASRFLTEVAELPGVVLLHQADPPVDGAPNPRDALSPQADWPVDPLGDRRPAVERAAAVVRAALAEPTSAVPPVVPPVVPPAVPEPAAVGGAGDPEDPWAREVALLLAERDAAGRRRLQVPLPAHLSASRVVALARDADALALRLRRPVPEAPSPQARRGSAFHAWLERRFGAAALVDVDELPGAADDAAADGDLAALQAAFLSSEWADRVPEAVEVSIETPVAGIVVRGRIDAVFRVGARAASPAEQRWDVVDWKTGTPPGDPAQARVAAVQLAVYRLAWSRLTGAPPDAVSAAFFYATSGRTVRPVDLLDLNGLVDLVTSVRAPGAAGPAPPREH